jgi:hypothetical protein
MKKNRRLQKKLRKQALKRGRRISQFTPFLLLSIGIIFLLINHLNSGQSPWLFIFGLILFSFTTAYLLVAFLECFLPSALVNHQFWTGEGNAGKGLAGLIMGVLAITILLGGTYILKIMNVGYVK